MKLAWQEKNSVQDENHQEHHARQKVGEFIEHVNRKS